MAKPSIKTSPRPTLGQAFEKLAWVLRNPTLLFGFAGRCVRNVRPIDRRMEIALSVGMLLHVAQLLVEVTNLNNLRPDEYKSFCYNMGETIFRFTANLPELAEKIFTASCEGPCGRGGRSAAVARAREMIDQTIYPDRNPGLATESLKAFVERVTAEPMPHEPVLTITQHGKEL